eukprot:PITA_27031
MFLAFKAFVEKQSGHQIPKLRSDNGREYVNNKFIKFSIENGIQMQHTIPYTLQQNDVAERKNHTLKEMANYVKGYKVIPLKSNNVINRIDVKFAENILAYEPSFVDVPPLSSHSTSENISSSNDDSEGDNPTPPSQDPPSAPQLPKWVYATEDAIGALGGDPTDQQRTRSQFDRFSSLLDQALANYDHDTFAEPSGHPDWDVAMTEEYRSLLGNDTWDLAPLPKGGKFGRCKWVYRTKYRQDGKFDKHKSHLVGNGFSQVEGIDYIETFSPVSKMNSIHLGLSLDASFKWEVH